MSRFVSPAINVLKQDEATGRYPPLIAVDGLVFRRSIEPHCQYALRHCMPIYLSRTRRNARETDVWPDYFRSADLPQLECSEALPPSELEDVGAAASKIVQIRQRPANSAAAPAVDQCGVRCSRRIDNLNR